MWGLYTPILFLVCITAVISGGIFPVVCQIAGSQGSVGKSVSLVYLINIIGATFGSLITGFYLLDKFPLTKAATVIFIAGLIGSLLILFFNRGNDKRVLTTRLVPIISLVFISLFFGDKMFYGFLENLNMKRSIRGLSFLNKLSKTEVVL